MLRPEIRVLYGRVEFGTSARFGYVHSGPLSRNAPFEGFDDVICRRRRPTRSQKAARTRLDRSIKLRHQRRSAATGQLAWVPISTWPSRPSSSLLARERGRERL